MYEEALSTWVPSGEHGGGAPLLQTLIERTAPSLGECTGGGSFTQDFERQVKEGPGNGVYLWEFCEGNTEGGLL
jgi:hypothetical protein